MTYDGLENLVAEANRIHAESGDESLIQHLVERGISVETMLHRVVTFADGSTLDIECYEDSDYILIPVRGKLINTHGTMRLSRESVQKVWDAFLFGEYADSHYEKE